MAVEHAGFKRLNRSGLEIRASERMTLDVRLEVGDVLQSVNVSAEAPLLDTTTSERGTSVSSKMMDNLPLFSGGIRNPARFVNYMPGVKQGGTRALVRFRRPRAGSD